MTNRSDIGNTLRSARESKGFSIHDISHYTRIPVKALHELEEGDYSSFPSPSYAKGFLAQYAEHLELDATDWLDDFEIEQEPLDLTNYEFLNDQEEELTPMPSHPAPQPSPREYRGRSKMSAAALQPLAVFIVSAMFLSAGVYGFIKLNDRFDTVAEEKAIPAEQPSLTFPEIPANDLRAQQAKKKSVPASPPLAAHTPAPSETSFSPAISEPISQQLSIDTAPPRAVIVEE